MVWRTLCTRVIRRAWKSRRLFCFLSPPPSSIFISAARRRKQRRRTPSALRGALPGSKFSSVRFVYGEDSCVRDVRVSPPGKNSLVFTCSEGAGQAAQVPRAALRDPDTSPTVRVFAHTDLKHLHTHPNTVSPGRNCVAPLCRALACSPADRRRRKKKEVLKISVAIDRMKPNGGIYFQPSGVNSLSGFGGGQATPCLSDVLSFRLANKQQTSTCRLFLSETDGQKSCFP